MVAQIDATIADYYLVREHHRNQGIGRPVMFFIKDVKSRMIMGMYDCALMALKNTVEDKVGFCKRYGVDISQEEWPCHHLPVSITADNGEMGDRGVEEVIAKLGITIENTPPYRGDLKGIIENAFSMVDLKLRYIVPGHVDKDDGQRGSINRRKEACIDLKTFIQMLIRCVLFYNNRHYMKTYQMAPEMMAHGVRPVPRDLWNYGGSFSQVPFASSPRRTSIKSSFQRMWHLSPTGGSASGNYTIPVKKPGMSPGSTRQGFRAGGASRSPMIRRAWTPFISPRMTAASSDVAC